MDELRCDPGWVEEQMEAYFGYRGGPLGVGEAAFPEVLEYFEDIFPASILQIWRIVGFDGIANGRHWITNPLEWAPAVESWLEGLELPFPDQRWWCIARTPMGSMQLWGETSGPALLIYSVLGLISPDFASHRNMLDPVMRERSGCVDLLSVTKDSARDDVSRRRLTDEGFKKFGSLGPGEVFALVPAYCLTGRLDASLLAKEPAVAHVAFLGQNTEPEMMPDLMASFGDALVEQIVTQDNEGTQPPSGSGQ